MKVLVVEDEHDVRRVLLTQLRPAGLHVSDAASGDDAFALLSTGYRPRIMVTDIVMPGLNGLELFEKLKEEDPWVRVIAISGVTAKKLNEAAAAGAMAILTKPVNPEELVMEIEKSLNERGSWLDVEG